MSENKLVDARGLSCPEPVLLTRAALREGKGAFTVALSSPAALDNVKRTLNAEGRKFEVRESGEDWMLDVDAACS